MLARVETITWHELVRSRLSRPPASRHLRSQLADDFYIAWLDNITSIDDSLLSELLMVLIMGASDDRLRLSDGFDDGVAPQRAVSVGDQVWLHQDEDPGLARRSKPRVLRPHVPAVPSRRHRRQRRLAARNVTPFPAPDCGCGLI